MVAHTRRISPWSGLNVGTAMPCARPVRPAWSEPSPLARNSPSSLFGRFPRAVVVSEGQLDAPRPQGQWALAWRRLKRDRVAVGCGLFLLVLVFAVGPGAPLYEKLVGHGPNDFFPYAVSVGLRPAGPFTMTWNTPVMSGDNPFVFKHPDPPRGTGKTLLLLGADSALGRDEFLRVLYGGRVSLTIAAGAALLAILIGIVLGAVAGYFGGWIDAV